MNRIMNVVAIGAAAGCLTAAAATVPIPAGDSPRADAVAESYASRKTVTVYADSEAEAIALANRQNPDWEAIDVVKRGNGRSYHVTMVMRR